MVWLSYSFTVYAPSGGTEHEHGAAGNPLMTHLMPGVSVELRQKLRVWLPLYLSIYLFPHLPPP